MAYHFNASVVDAGGAGRPTPSSSGYGDNNADGLRVVIVGAGIAGLATALSLRQQGHHVTVTKFPFRLFSSGAIQVLPSIDADGCNQVLERSTLSEEDGASVDLPPHANGALRRFGLFAENLGGNTTCNGACLSQRNAVTEFDQAGNRRSYTAQTSALWQHPWYRVSRKALHDALREAATSTEGPGSPAVLKLRSAVSEVDPVTGSVYLQGGEQVQGDLVVGADGIHSKLRETLVKNNEGHHDVVRSSYSFYIPNKTLASHATLAKYVKEDGQSFSWVGSDRRLDFRPLSNNTEINVLVTCPTSQSDGTTDLSHSRGKKSTLAGLFKDFHADVGEIVALADDPTLQVWNLYDVPGSLSSIKERLILIGEAAHTAYGSQRVHNTGQALDDVGALAALLPAATAPDRVPDALAFYLEFRQERLDRIAESVKSVEAQVIASSTGDNELGIDQLTACLLGYDAWDAAKQAGQRHFNKHNRKNWLRQPIQLGLYPSLRQHASGKLRRPQNHVTWTRYAIRFRTSRTVLDGFLGEGFSFRSPSSVAEASWVSGWTKGMDWLGGDGYHHTALMLHNVDYTKKNGEVIHGSYLVMMIEDQTDAILGGHDDSGMAKLYCEIDFRRIDGKAKVTFSWRGRTFAEIGLEGLSPPEAAGATATPKHAVTEPVAPPLPAETGLLYERYVGAVGQPGVADAQYPVYSSYKGASGSETKTTKMEVASNGSVTYYRGDELSLPTWHGYVDRFAEMPFYGFVSGYRVEGTGVDDNRGTVRIE
ncbi:hypothetical protein BDV12DRAFT_203654 [Aspergillus spectabilis]